MHFFRISDDSDGETIILGEPAQVHHLKDVLRLGAGDQVTVIDGRGDECLCEVTVFSEGGVILKVKSRVTVASPTAKVAIGCALPKKGMDEVVDKLTQLGVDVIIPMLTERVVVNLGGAAAVARLERWRRLADSAAGQSRRRNVPELRPLAWMGEVMSLAEGYDLKLIPTLSGERRAMGEVIGGGMVGSVIALIGPEGDFTEKEIEAARQAGFVPVSLGAQVLRVDTAAIAVAAYLKLAAAIPRPDAGV
jgi:16S rRNA (uracil1498-N3)-methyltransferase